MDTTKLAALVAAIDAGSLSRGAERIGARLSTLSRQVADLEAELGAPLLVRTGRGVRATPAGERFVERARALLRDLDAARAEVRGEAELEASTLRLSAPPDLSLRLLPRVVVELAAKYPRLAIEARAETRRVSLLEEGYDAAVRLGPLADSGLVAQRLGSITRVLCAAPRGRGSMLLRSVRDLERVEHVGVVGGRNVLAGTHRGRAFEVALRCAISVGSFAEAAEVAARSPRVVVLPSFVAAPHLEAGSLVRVLPALVLPRVDVQLVHARKPRLAAVLRELGARLAAALHTEERVVASRTSAPRNA